MSAPVADRVDAVLGVLRESAERDYIGESINQLEHALQCAYFARQAGASDEAVVAALLHDLGHLIDDQAPTMAGLGVVDHEVLGANFLRSLGFSNTVTRLVEGHVQAKRYLTYKKPADAARLSEASRGTLRWQGGPMSDPEAAAFEADPLFRMLLAIRAWDERAKVVGLDVPGLDTYRELLSTQLERR